MKDQRKQQQQTGNKQQQTPQLQNRQSKGQPGQSGMDHELTDRHDRNPQR